MVDPARLHHRHPVTPYAGRPLTGVVRGTWLRGRPITGDGPPEERCSPGERHDPEPDPDRLHRPARPGLAQPRRRRVVAANDELFAERENLIKPEAPGYRPTPSATRARCTTAGRPGGGASPATTGRSCGSACPGWSAGWWSTPPSSPATTRRRARSRAPRSRATRPRDELQRGRLDAAGAPVRGARATPRNRFEVRRDRRGSPTSGCAIYPDGGVARLRVHGEVRARPAAARRRRPRPGRAGARRRGRSAAATCSTPRPAT